MRVRNSILATASVIALAVPLFGAVGASAAETPVVSDNASQNACFGQWRASTADGSVFADRKGTNADHNVTDKAYCAA